MDVAGAPRLAFRPAAANADASECQASRARVDVDHETMTLDDVLQKQVLTISLAYGVGFLDAVGSAIRQQLLKLTKCTAPAHPAQRLVWDLTDLL